MVYVISLGFPTANVRAVRLYTIRGPGLNARQGKITSVDLLVGSLKSLAYAIICIMYGGHRLLAPDSGRGGFCAGRTDT